MPLPLIIAAVGAAASIGSSALGASKADKERYMMQQLSFLNNEQTLKLNQQLANAKSEEERQKILGSTLEGIAAARVKGLSTVQVEKEKTKKQLITVAIVGGVLVILTLVLITRKK